MFRPLERALFSQRHLVILFVAVWGGPLVLAGEALDLWVFDYRRIILAMTLAYWAGVVFEIAIHRPIDRRRRQKKKGDASLEEPPLP